MGGINSPMQDATYPPVSDPQNGALPGLVKRQRVLEQYRRHVNIGLAKLNDLMGLPLEIRSAGCLVFDEEDNAYLDCGGYGVFLLGHCHPTVIAAVKAQLERHPLSTRLLPSPELAQAAESLAGIAPEGLDFVYFTNSGAEATEVGIKIACLNGKSKLISMQRGFHGKTIGALSVTGRLHYQHPFASLLPPVRFLPFGDIDALRKALIEEGDQACVILEPIQAEGGVRIPPVGYLRAVQDLCQRYGAFLIVDEIQTGMGRLGSWWGCEREDVVPDVLLAGKSLSGGVVPVGAAVCKAAAYAPLNQDPLMHSSTFAGNPLAMAAVQAAISVIAHENLLTRTRELGEQLIGAIQQILAETCPDLVTAVRGLGLLIGIEFQADHLAGDFMLELLKQKVIVSHSLNAHRVMRLTPSALLTQAQCDWLLHAIREAASALKQYAASIAVREEDL